MAGLQELVVKEHMLDVNYRVRFMGKLSEATVKVIQSEIEEHIAHALKSRGLIVRAIDQDEVTIEASA